MEYVCSLINGGYHEINITRMDNNAGYRVTWPSRRISVEYLTTAWKDALIAAMDYFAALVGEYRKCFGDCFVIR